MELASLFLLVLLPPADATGDTATAVSASLRHELGDVAMAIAPDTLVTPAMWQGEKATMRARFVVHLIWNGKDTASIEVFSPSSAPTTKGFRRSRAIAFSPQDSKTERGRAIGLVVAELLRESPASALAIQSVVGREILNAGPPSHLVLGGMFVVERVATGNWAMGPELTYDFGLSETTRLQASGTALFLFGSTYQYIGIGAGVGVCWDFLRSQNGRHALGGGLEVDVLHESLTMASDDSRGAFKWNLALGANISGRMTVWRNLRVIGELDLRATSGIVSMTVGEEHSRTQYSFSRWRPVFALGLELAL